MYLTAKQIEVIRVVAAGNPDGSVADLDEIIDRVSYKPTKQAIQFSIRALIEHGLIEKVGTDNRRGRRRTLIAATVLGQHFAAANKTSVASAILESDEGLLE